MSDLSVTLEHQRDGACLVTLRGEMDLTTVEDFVGSVFLVEAPIEIDCQHLSFIAGAGLSALARLAQFNVVTLLNESAMLRRLLDVCQMTDLFEHR